MDISDVTTALEVNDFTEAKRDNYGLIFQKDFPANKCYDEAIIDYDANKIEVTRYTYTDRQLSFDSFDIAPKNSKLIMARAQRKA